MIRQTSPACSRPAWLLLTATSAPAEASASAIARPRPREAPVTKAFLPSKLKWGISKSWDREADEARTVAIGWVSIGASGTIQPGEWTVS
jgi:hypothetical protein